MKPGHRIGYDPATEEIVVFFETHRGQGIYHGFVADYRNLRQSQRNALYKSRLVDLRGKAIG